MLIADHRVSKGPEGPDAAGGSYPEPQGLGARTRDRVRQAISEHGPIIVPALAFRLGLTPAAVRGRLHPTSRGDAAHGEHVCTTFIPMSAVPVRAIAALKAPKARPHLMKGPHHEQHH